MSPPVTTAMRFAADELEALGMTGATLYGDTITFHFTNRDEDWRRCDPQPLAADVCTFNGQCYKHVRIRWAPLTTN